MRTPIAVPVAVLLAVLVAVLLAASTAAGAPARDWSGEWVTDLGPLEMAQVNDKVQGTYGQGATLTGSVEGAKLVIRWKNGDSEGEGVFERGDDPDAFTGSWRGGGGSGAWRGWRKDPEAEDARRADFSGVWASSLGNLVLEQKGDEVTGTYGSQGWATVEGQVKGRRLHLRWKRLQWAGPAWIELTRDGKRFFGLTKENPPAKWLGVKIEGFEPAVKPKAGEVVRGLAENAMFYHLRAPDTWRSGRKCDALVLLHGSNWTTAGMVAVTARACKDFAEDAFVIGIQGEQWADFSDADDLRHNYTYVNWMGRSTYKGYPNTDRESPYLVMQVIEELRKRHNLDRVFVGGHSQGAFLAYLLAMNYPEDLAGVFAASGGLVMQAEPDVFDDPRLTLAQRALPVAIVHGTQDDVVPFATGQYVWDRFVASGFAKLRLFAPERPHAYDFLPLAEVVAWLDALSTKKADVLLDFAKERAAAGDWRDVAAALVHADEIKAASRLKPLQKQLDAEAQEEATSWLAKIQANADGSWVDGFLAWRDLFEFAPAAAETMAAFRTLQNGHDRKAEGLIAEARQAFREGKQDEGWAKYQQIVDELYACRRYRIVKRWLAER